MNFNISKFVYKIICDSSNSDVSIDAISNENELDIYISATNDKPRFVVLDWETESKDDILVLGDAWERSYGNLQFADPAVSKHALPWYFIATDKKSCFCLGVKTGCNSFVSFKYGKNSITAIVDCRNGGNGVHLNGRKVKLATFITAKYDNGNIFENLKDFCKKMCNAPVLPKERIYGGNNWYYAYGKSSYKQIISDTKLQVELSQGIDNKPFQVIDDCWQIHKCAGPWYPNRKFKDMKKLADEIRQIGARPGIWVRLLRNKDKSIKKEMRIHRDGKRYYLDPTHPYVQSYIKGDIERIKNWGYELIKHDFTTADLFGSYGKDLDETITNSDNWHFYNKTKTNAEITLDLYRLIKETAGDMLIIGCNTVSHLSAGLVHIYRTGDDTSGTDWNRTKAMGVNTLAFRLAQNEAFYMCDADCVGILKNKIPWDKNKQWLHLLSYSNTPLFVSCTDSINNEQKEDIRTAYKVFNKPHSIEPLDFYETTTPELWRIDGNEIKYNW